MALLRLLCIGWFACWVSTTQADSVKIDMSEPTVDRVMFNRARPPQDMPKLTPNEAALTRSNYECRASVNYEVVSSTKVGDHWHDVIAVRKVHLEARLTDTIFLPMMAPTLLRAHEEGHRAMNERIYKEGEAVARAAAAAMIAKSWDADGPDRDAAGKAASDAAVQSLCKAYLEGDCRPSVAPRRYLRPSDQSRAQSALCRQCDSALVSRGAAQPRNATGRIDSSHGGRLKLAIG